jgi:hypothetical protein
MMASITSPEHGAQQECSSNFFPPLGSSNFSLVKLILNTFFDPSV